MSLKGRAHISVARPIAASAAKIFQVLADPANHPALDGSGMLRVALDQLQPDGDTTIVTEIFDCTDAAESIRDDVEDGQAWLSAMHQTLERLAALVEAP